MIKVYDEAIGYVVKGGREWIINKKNYKDILNYLKDKQGSEYIKELEENGLIEELVNNREKVLSGISKSLKRVDGAMPIPHSFNIELTQKCPLKCPQCYCSMEKGKEIDLNLVRKYIKEASNVGINYVNLSGGETLAYPHIAEVIECCKENSMLASIAISGWGFDKSRLKALIAAGIYKIYVSLNGSKREINGLTRDGYELAINALKILKESTFENYCINWVAHNNNIDDFPNLLKIAEQFNVKTVCILGLKPDNKNEMNTIPTVEKFYKLASIVRKYKNEKLGIEIEGCYADLRFAVYGNKIKKNYCLAGRKNFALLVDGSLAPCRHMEIGEKYEHIIEYWRNSSVLKAIRNSCQDVRKPCSDCIYLEKCIPCIATCYKVNNLLYRGNQFCITGVTNSMEEMNE